MHIDDLLQPRLEAIVNALRRDPGRQIELDDDEVCREIEAQFRRLDREEMRMTTAPWPESTERPGERGDLMSTTLADKMYGAIADALDSCGNTSHPNGPWHPAEPLPRTMVERVRQWWRRRTYGCGCPVRPEDA